MRWFCWKKMYLWLDIIKIIILPRIENLYVKFKYGSTDVGQPEQNWNNRKIKGYDLGVST